MYDVSAYFFAKVTAEFPLSVLIPLIFDVIIYFSIGLNTTHIYIFFTFGKILIKLSYFVVGITILTYMTAGSYALVISCMISEK